MSKIIELDHVTVSYRENIALRNITLEIDEGSFVSVIGPNGAGKTTLLTVINGLGAILSGSVKVFGQRIENKNISQIRKDIGYIPQHLNIDPRSPISVYQAVSIGRFGKIGLFKKWTSADDDLVRSAMAEVGISNLENKPIGHLSGGEHQKVSIARALAQQPKIILFDEPTSNLDPKSQGEIMRLIERIYSEKKYTIVFVTHILSHIPACCDYAVLMQRGKIMYAGSSEKALKENLLSKLYDCPIEIGLIHGKRHFHAGQSHL
ncbi:MAG: ABC transporter ATP-binding protein [Elusimicrobiota bacterium]